jgi:hypothetical protein
MISHSFFSHAAESCFLNLKDGPLNSKKKTQHPNNEAIPIVWYFFDPPELSLDFSFNKVMSSDSALSLNTDDYKDILVITNNTNITDSPDNTELKDIKEITEVSGMAYNTNNKSNTVITESLTSGTSRTS